jgi:glutaminyl-tRNA synthetase
VEFGFLEHCLREDLNAHAQRAMAVLRPIRLTITNYPEDKRETVTVENNPNDPEAGSREVPFSRNLYIEADDFLQTPIPKYKRLYPNGPECRLKGAYLITCTGCVTDGQGNVVEVLATYDPDSRGGDPKDGRKVKGATIHWVDADDCVEAEVRLYSNLFADADPDGSDKDYIDCLNPDSLVTLQGCKLEKMLGEAKAPAQFQFLRLGYFCVDSKDSSPEHPVFNRAVALKDSFRK